MKKRIRTLACLALALVGAFLPLLQVSGQSPDAKGLIVINNGNTSVQFSTVGEWRKFESYGQTYRAEMTDGQVFSGPKGVVILWIDYRDSDAVQKLKQLAEAIPDWADFAEAKTQELTKPRPRDSGGTGSARTDQVLDRLELGGKVYTRVKPSSMADGMIGLIHDEGALRLPADLFSHQSLMRLGRIGPGLQGSREFVSLVDTFEPTVFAGGKVMSGVRLSRQEGDRLVLLTDEGEVTIDKDDIRPEMLRKATAAGSRYTQWKAALAAEEKRRLEAAQRESELAFEREKARIERATEAAKFWWTVGRVVVNEAFRSR